MPQIAAGGIKIAYLDEGVGDPVLLIHGFASSKEVNWVNTGWVDSLVKAGRRAIAFDNRGHGASSKLYDPEDYRLEEMAADAIAVLDHVGVPEADVIGYSMGGRIAATLALDHAFRVRSAIIGGLGTALVDSWDAADRIVAGLEAPSLDAVTDEIGRMFRKFAEQTRSDLAALAACMRMGRQTIAPERLVGVTVPVLIAAGTRDTMSGSPRGLAALIPGAEVLDIPGRDHMLAVGDKAFKAGALDFLDRRP